MVWGRKAFKILIGMHGLRVFGNPEDSGLYHY